MIRRFNQSSRLKAAFHSIGGLICLSLAYLFFRYVPAFVAKSLGYPLSPLMAHAAAFTGTVLICWGGYRAWQNGEGLHGYEDSSFYHDLGEDTAGAVVVDSYAARVTGPAYVIGQVFLAGPLWLLRARHLMQKRLPDSAELEGRLEQALRRLQQANKWQTMDDHPGMELEIRCLARMDLIDFSARHNVTKFKARPVDGN